MNLLKRTLPVFSFRSSVEIKGDVFIKSGSPPPGNRSVPPNDLQGEAEELKRCIEAGIRTQYVAPVEFISYDNEADCLTTKFISNGTSLFNVMWNSSSLINRIRKRPSSPGFIISRCEEIGKWLSMYHNSTSSPQSKAQVIKPLKASFKRKIERIRKNNLVKEAFLRKVEEVFFPEIEKLASDDYLEQSGIKICKIHGDFTPPNMLVDDSENIWIIDFANARIGTSFEDLGRFYELLYAIAQTSNYKRIFLEGNEGIYQRLRLTSGDTGQSFFSDRQGIQRHSQLYCRLFTAGISVIFFEFSKPSHGKCLIALDFKEAVNAFLEIKIRNPS